MSEPTRTVFVKIAGDEGWKLFTGPATDKQIQACYRLNSRESRATYWSKVLDQDIPPGRGLIWWTQNDDRKPNERAI